MLFIHASIKDRCTQDRCLLRTGTALIYTQHVKNHTVSNPALPKKVGELNKNTGGAQVWLFYV